MAEDALWMPLYIADYLADTMHLNAEQHGAYIMLLMASWQRGGSLPSDESQLSSIARLTPAAWRKNKSVLLAFFDCTDDGIAQKRLTSEYAKAKHLIDVKRANGKKGGRPPKQNLNETENITKEKPIGLATDNLQAKLQETQSQSQSELQGQNLHRAGGGFTTTGETPSPQPPQFQTTIANWQPKPDVLKQLREISGCPAQFIDEQLAEFRMYWRDRDSPKTSWDSAFFKSCTGQWKGNGHNWKPAPEKTRGSTFDDLTDTSWFNPNAPIPELEIIPGGGS